MNPTLTRHLPALAAYLPDLLRLRSALMPTPPPPALADLGLADDAGITRKGQKLLDLCLSLAALLDLPLH